MCSNTELIKHADITVNYLFIMILICNVSISEQYVPHFSGATCSDRPAKQDGTDGKPAPTEASRTRLPFFRRPSATASASARGIVPAVVLPYFSILMTTFSSRQAKPLGGRHDDAAIGLMRHEQIDIGAGHVVALHDARADFLGLLHGEFEDRLPILLHVMQPLIDGLVRRRPEAAARGHAQRRSAAAIDLVREVDDAAVVCRRADDDRARRRRRTARTWIDRCSR